MIEFELLSCSIIKIIPYRYGVQENIHIDDNLCGRVTWGRMEPLKIEGKENNIHKFVPKIHLYTFAHIYTLTLTHICKRKKYWDDILCVG